MIMVTTQGVENILANLNFNKAEGPDGISPCVLREFAKEAASVLMAIYWSSLRAANHYILVIVYCAWVQCTMLLTLMMKSLHPPPKKTKKTNSIPCMRVGIKYTSNGLPLCLFCVCGVDCVPAIQRLPFKPAYQSLCLVQFLLLCITSWQNNFHFQSLWIAMLKQKAECRLLGCKYHF